MKLLSVNRGAARNIVRKGTERVTGIYKEPVTGPLRIEKLGLAGDLVADEKHHGGPDQAIYIYGQTDYDWWAGELGSALPPGTFGENLTIAGLESTAFKIGDTLTIGGVTLQVTAPRIPCATLSAKIGDPQFVKKFSRAERPGLYCRVLQEGEVQAGDPVSVARYEGATVSILEMFRDAYTPDKTEAGLRRFLAAPIDIRSREEKEGMLREITQP
jgi:MOSC domain-containing protein YiiM